MLLSGGFPLAHTVATGTATIVAKFQAAGRKRGKRDGRTKATLLCLLPLSGFPRSSSQGSPLVHHWLVLSPGELEEVVLFVVVLMTLSRYLMFKITWSVSKEAQEMDISTSCLWEKGQEVGKENQQMLTPTLCQALSSRSL